jgi:hypothetical protein
MIVYFPHIPKAGGQTLLQGFYKAFGFAKCLKVWNPNFGADVSPEQFASLEKTRFEGVSAIVGHLSVSTFLMNNCIKGEFEKGNVRIITSVRDPVTRILSLYNYIAYNEEHPDHESIKNTSPIDFIMHEPANYQFNFLKPGAKSTLDDIYRIVDVFPIESSIEKFTSFFADNFNIKLNGMEIRNKSIDWADGRNIITVDDIGKDDLADLQKKHQVDFDLHHKSLDNC